MPTLLEILNVFPSCCPPIETLINVISPLQPRFYSAINTPLAEPDKVKFVFNVAEFCLADLWNRIRHGVCTVWLDELAERPIEKNQCRNLRPYHLTIPIYKRPNSVFQVPEDSSKSLILVGSGTGVAPFLGFLEHRRQLASGQAKNQRNSGEIWLFFGCRHVSRDFLYETQLESYEADKTLTRLILCSSREPHRVEGRRYIQDGLRQYAYDILRLMFDQQANWYLCGNISHQLRDIEDTLIHLLQQFRSLSLDEAREFLKIYIGEKRWIRDVWA